MIPDWFYLPYCGECEKYKEFVKMYVPTINHIDFKLHAVFVRTILKRLVKEKLDVLPVVNQLKVN